MPTPPVFAKLFIRTDLDSDVIILDNVLSWARGIRTIRTGTYRDTGWAPGKGVSWSSGATGVNTQPLVTEVPVVGQVTATPTGSSATGAVMANLKYANPDELDHIAPRFYQRRESGYLFSFVTGDIPGPPAVAYGSIAFTVNTTSNVCSTATAHPFLTGDLIAVAAATTLAAPLVASAVYSVAKVSDTSFMLRTSTGAVVDFTTAGSGQQLAVQVESAAIPANETGVVFIPDAWNPRLSTTDPRS